MTTTTIALQLILIAAYTVSNQALPSSRLIKLRITREISTDLSSKIVVCKHSDVGISECIEDLKQSQLSSKIARCLDNCANCVKQWKVGVYNGRSCANDCVQQFSNPDVTLSESLDPDCNLVRYFNTTLLASVEKK